MEDLDQIQQELKRGDKQRLAEVTYSSLDTVIKVLNGERSSETVKGRLIVQSAIRLLEQRVELQAFVKSQLAVA